LRPWTEADLPEFIRVSNTPTVVEHLSMRRRRDLDFDRPAYVEGHPLRPHITYVIAPAAFAGRPGALG
jgi:hypothetical protein